ncbi:hypothetical protein HH308_15360 [Gordonia sp. TBRC 11910]|uniref:Uncharacterized protein n=1 Tax=Gordonia asplenii TaxID=2725283 RepID=A0A848KWH4_9ACTN|nr:hypothetical protein [Gordonia asplenii]NMO02592.1 hypothetical protein [Gordonia asplenii]
MAQIDDLVCSEVATYGAPVPSCPHNLSTGVNNWWSVPRIRDSLRADRRVGSATAKIAGGVVAAVLRNLTEQTFFAEEQSEIRYDAGRVAVTWCTSARFDLSPRGQ